MRINGCPQLFSGAGVSRVGGRAELWAKRMLLGFGDIRMRGAIASDEFVGKICAYAKEIGDVRSKRKIWGGERSVRGYSGVLWRFAQGRDVVLRAPTTSWRAPVLHGPPAANMRDRRKGALCKEKDKTRREIHGRGRHSSPMERGRKRSPSIVREKAVREQKNKT